LDLDSTANQHSHVRAIIAQAASKTLDEWGSLLVMVHACICALEQDISEVLVGLRGLRTARVCSIARSAPMYMSGIQ
jgi:hypothetical protein